MKNCPMRISFVLSSILFIPALEAFAPSFPSDRSASSATRPSQRSTNLNSLPTSLDTLTSGLASISRIQYGVTVSPDRVSLTGPAAFYLPKLKILYDVENSRACRSVRERITELDLAVDKVIPSAQNSRVMNGGLEGVEKPSVVPTLVAIVEGKEQKFQGEHQILEFLNDKFSNEKRKSQVRSVASSPTLESSDGTESNVEIESAVTQIKEILSDLTKYLPGLLRPGRGTKVASTASFTLPNVPRPRNPLILYSYEGNQFCRLVREIFTELDLSYELRSAGKGSFRREELSEITGGSSQCPYLIDPNTGIQMPESKDIIQYLFDTYALWTPPNELLRVTSDVVTPLLTPLYKVIAPLQAGSYRENEFEYQSEIAEAKAEIFDEVSTAAVVVCECIYHFYITFWTFDY
ncbi:hypothetical protein ACHAXS_007235 [Conticribra weissflogii]